VAADGLTGSPVVSFKKKVLKAELYATVSAGAEDFLTVPAPAKSRPTLLTGPPQRCRMTTNGGGSTP
jgi:hypothetical protein